MESLAAAIADWSGRTRGGYVISLHKRHGRADLTGAFVSHRTIAGSDSDFATAVRRASHEGPDILLIIGPQTEMALHEAVFARPPKRRTLGELKAGLATYAKRRHARR